jgi:hypothetical protein
MPFNVTVNFIAVIIASVISFIVGFLWYGPLFGKLWMKLNNLSDKDIKKAKEKGMAGMILLSFIGTLITVYVFAILIGALGIGGSIAGGIQLGFWLWLGFLVATTLLGSVLWDNKPWALFLLNSAYWLLNLEVIAIILSFWS